MTSHPVEEEELMLLLRKMRSSQFLHKTSSVLVTSVAQNFPEMYNDK